MAERDPERDADVNATVLAVPTFLSVNAATGDANAIFRESPESAAGTLTSVNALGVEMVAEDVWLYTRDDGVISEPPIVRGRCVMLAVKVGNVNV